ncbi:glycosyltransferase family 4 protein [Aliiglaciecola sp. 2_MG-2023]|uniref:glycosyltransferase family 4 protein n=1 Tax=unclassified Aliiglaciecola TaxID=2593648 RepID=UPI0026E291AD|nr:MULTISPECIES: glycosyltransferase family 4 protein [unclassified Aliiglaciecola]MDO6712883.1 glycosyltransferase family 4 protein [Aliiglaciecola sp. 2_MG-2023]MDO6752881.1 glycosyltransferase family 4 protein [Aliiglaciecola sp. 1_MG-2023]
MNKILVVHPTGNQNSKGLARGLAEANLLYAFVTALHLDSNKWNWLPTKLVAEIKRRDFSEIKSTIISGSPLREGLRLLAIKLKLNFLTKHEVGFSSVDNVYHATDRFASKYLKKYASEITGVYCYEDGALETFKIAKQLNIKCIYELPIGYWRTHHRLNEEESVLQPEWGRSWIATQDSKPKLTRKDEELALADHIIVASSFTKKTLEDYPKALAPITHVPYGCPLPNETLVRNWFQETDKLKVLYVGGLSQRKGLSYLVEAISALDNKVEFSYIGNGSALELMQEKLPNATYLGTMPHSQVLEAMRDHDVLVFPSLFEGFGMVITEAMSQGMVVIATDHTALPDIAGENTGILIPVRDSGVIKDALSDLISNPEKVEKIGKSAMRLAQSYQWIDYESKIVKAVVK